jgi:tetratricopeptide (TPR) repeat protein
MVVSHELASYIESLIRPSVVLVTVDGVADRTGFFVSRDGLVCTCWHPSLYPQNQVSVKWNGETYPADLVFSLDKADLVLLAVQGISGQSLKTQPLPISSELLPTTNHRHAAASLGYAALKTYGTREEPKMPLGALTTKYDFKEHQERFEIYGISGDHGNSGAPVIDMQRLRVLGYVQSSYKVTEQQIGHALTFGALLRERPELAADWRWACEEFDLALAQQYATRPFPLDLEYCPGDFVSSLVAGHIAAVFANHRDPLFQLNRYAPRAVETTILGFLGEATGNLMLLSGASGSGKTSLLLNLTRQMDGKQYLPLLIKCDGLKIQDLPRAAFNTLVPIEHYELTRLGQLCARVPDKTWVLFFDGLNECTDFSADGFRAVVEALRSLLKVRGVNLKIVFSVRSEFLREHLPVFLWQGVRQDDPGADLLQYFLRDDRGQPYLSVGRINTTRLPDDRLELEAMYEQYCNTGLKPTTTFAQLTEPIRELLDRPFVLELMMTIYHGVEIPLNIGRSNLLRLIVQKTLEKARVVTGVRANRMGVYLGALAAFILRSQTGLSCRDSDIYNQSWHKGDELEVLLTGTPFLERESIRRGFGEESVISFSADWTFEFFLARFLWGEWWREHGGKDPANQLSELHELLPPETAQLNLPHLLMALVFFAEWAATDEPSRFSFLVKVMNDSSQESFAKGFTRECLDFFRITYGFTKNIQSSDGHSQTSFLTLLSDNAAYFEVTGGAALLDYVEYLETIGEAKDVTSLLELDVCRQAIAGNQDLEARRHLSLALASFDSHDIDGAFSQAAKVDPEKLSTGLLAKHSFIIGRAYQFKGDYMRAEHAFEIGRKQSGRYAYRCEHQLSGFIPIILRSDFASTLDQLEHILANTSFGLTREQRFASMLLRAICLFRLGRYAEAEVQLHEIIRLRIIQRNKQGTGLGLRALAEVHFRKFEHEAAHIAIDQAIETLHGRSYYLSLASAYDTKANILGLLAGEMVEAEACNQASLELSREAKHEANIRWFMQTKALLSALKGQLAGVHEALQQAGAINPYEKLHQRFILLLARHCSGENLDEQIETEIRELQSDFHSLQLAWYPGVLSLIQWAGAGVMPDKEMAAAVFPENTDIDGLLKSHLFSRIFADR